MAPAYSAAGGDDTKNSKKFMSLKVVRPKKVCKNMGGFFAQTTANFCETSIIHNIG
jgi:hypothetical protein